MNRDSDRAVPEVPAPGLRRGGRAGRGRPDAEERDRLRPGAPGLSLRRPPRDRQDLDGPHPREGAQLRPRPDPDAGQHLQRVRDDRGRHLAGRGRDGRRLAARDRRRPRDPRAGRAPAGRGALQGLHPRRGAPAHGRGLERAAEVDRGASAPPRLRLLHDRPGQGAPDRPVALPDVRLLAAASAGPREAAAHGRRRREVRGARRRPLADRTGGARVVPRRGLDARPARRRDRGADHRPVRAATPRALSRRRRSSGCAT